MHLDSWGKACQNSAGRNLLHFGRNSMSQREDVLSQALTLAPLDRAFLIDELEQSLESEGFANAEVAAAWQTEVERRLAAYDRGESRGLEASAAISEMRERLNG